MPASWTKCQTKRFWGLFSLAQWTASSGDVSWHLFFLRIVSPSGGHSCLPLSPHVTIDFYVWRLSTCNVDICSLDLTPALPCAELLTSETSFSGLALSLRSLITFPENLVFQYLRQHKGLTFKKGL